MSAKGFDHQQSELIKKKCKHFLAADQVFGSDEGSDI